MAFLGSLHWPEAGSDIGFGGVSSVELLILYEPWAGVRFVLEKAHLRYLRPGRPISVSAVPFGPGIDIWRSCRFVGSLTRSLCTLLGGLLRLSGVLLVLTIAGFVMLGGRGVVMGLPPGHGESASEALLNELLQLFQFPPISAPSLLAGTLSLMCCTVRFASKVTTWRLPVSGHAACMVPAALGVVNGGGAEVGNEEVHWVRSSGRGRKRIRLNRKTPAHFVGR